MSKETKYQNDAQLFIEDRSSSYAGHSINIYTENNSKQYDSVLQEASPIIGGKRNDPLYLALKNQHQITGLREKLYEFNYNTIERFLKKHHRTETIDDIVETEFQDFVQRHQNVKNEAEEYSLIFLKNQDMASKNKRMIHLNGIREGLEYNVIHYEKPWCYEGKNDFFFIRERRVPVLMHQYKMTERPDFAYYINGIPLVFFEWKTEDSGILKSIEDFQYKESYKKVPFKVALNDGRDVLFFAETNSLKLKEGKDNFFKWIHYHPAKKHIASKNGVPSREYTNTEYLLDELFCQPENMYNYCVNGCSVVHSKKGSHLINARIQQYYAIKAVRKTLVDAMRGVQAMPYNFEFAHTQRSGKTISMKQILYMIHRSFYDLINTVFIYVPDLQIKTVIENELVINKSETTIKVKVIKTRVDYQKVLEELLKNQIEGIVPTAMNVYIVNMQKITDENLSEISIKDLSITSSKILNIIDEAHYGQTRKAAELRQKMFPNASNYLFTATGKTDMYLFYFPDNIKNGYCDKFTFSDAKQCGITVPVAYFKADKIFNMDSDRVHAFSKEVEGRLESDFIEGRQEIGEDILESEIESYLDHSIRSVSNVVQRKFRKGDIINKLNIITRFMDEAKRGLPFAPKGIIYVPSKEVAKKYIKTIQDLTNSNDYKGYRFGMDFSGMDDINDIHNVENPKQSICQRYNQGISLSSDVSACFQRDRKPDNDPESKVNSLVIDILIVVDKYQKGFDLPTLLVTFLDTDIHEASKINQIFTRTATKYPGKVMGYCVDLTLDTINENCFKESLLLYDSPDDLGDGFIDAKLLEALNEALTTEFEKLRTILELTPDTFTPNLILHNALNGGNPEALETKQRAFFTISQNIIRILGRMGSPLFFKPFALELKAIKEAFAEFNLIYADKSHQDYSKIVYQKDESFSSGVYISDTEIKEIINEVLSVLNEKSISDFLSFEYANNFSEITLDEKAKDETAEKLIKFIQDTNRNRIKKIFENDGDYLKRHHTELHQRIKDMLLKIGVDRTLIYREPTYSEINNIIEGLETLNQENDRRIDEEFGGDAFLFWTYETTTIFFEKYGVHQPSFVSFFAKELSSKMSGILQDIDSRMTMNDKINTAIEIFENKPNTFISFMTTFVDYKKKENCVLIEDFSEQLKAVVDADGKSIQILTRKDIFEENMKTILRRYYEYITEASK